MGCSSSGGYWGAEWAEVSRVDFRGKKCGFLRIFPRFSAILRTDQGRIYAILRIFTGDTYFLATDETRKKHRFGKGHERAKRSLEAICGECRGNGEGGPNGFPPNRGQTGVMKNIRTFLKLFPSFPPLKPRISPVVSLHLDCEARRPAKILSWKLVREVGKKLLLKNFGQQFFYRILCFTRLIRSPSDA